MNRKTILTTLLALLGAASIHAATDYYRLSWRDNPATTMVVGWRQSGGTNATVHYGTVDQGTNYASYPLSATVARSASAMGMTHEFARLSGLTPDTAYYFVVRDSSGTSARMWFRTAPSVAKDFSYVVGGDSRNNRTPRQQANRMVSKLRPLFVFFGGDYTDGNTSAEWNDWFADWQQTKSSDGRMYPIVATRGNHDDNTSLVNMFDIPNANVYYALGIGGTYMRLYTLNSEITATGTQATWLVNDLAANSGVKWKIAQFHKPFFPHESAKAENTTMYSAWAQPFYDYGMSLVCDSDSHCVKTTWPVRPTGNTSPSSAFTRDDTNGTVYVGEGCWGAPLRSANDLKPYTRDAGSFNMVQWVHARADRMELRTITVANVDSVASVSDNAPLALPSGLSVWTPTNGAVITMYPRGGTPPPTNVAPTVAMTSPAGGSSFTAPATISLAANAADSDGTVSKVEFFQGSTLLATDTSSPYSFSWTNVAAGSYTLTARATDNSGAVTTSSGVNVSVTGTGGSTPVTVALQDGLNGYAGTTDTKIRSDAATTKYGTNTALEIDGSPDYAALLKFNLSSIPAGKTVTSVSLSVNVSDLSAQVYEVYALKRAWSEANATWNQADTGVNWGTAGANNTTSDRETTVLATLSSSTTGVKTFNFNAAGIAKVQSWVNTPSSNHGFIVMDYVNNSDGLDINSSEVSTTANRPKLTVTYE